MRYGVVTQTVRIRDRWTGKEVTLSFDDVKKGRFKISAMGDNGEMANLEIGGGEGRLPSWVPTYPGARAQGNLTAKGASADGMGEGGVVTFTTPDPPSKVTDFYQEKCSFEMREIHLRHLLFPPRGDLIGVHHGQDVEQSGGHQELGAVIVNVSGGVRLAVAEADA